MNTQFTKINNGHALILVIDKDSIFADLDELIKACDDAKKDIEEGLKDGTITEEDISNVLSEYDLPTDKLYEDYERCSIKSAEDVDKIRQCYVEAKNTVEQYIKDNAALLWDKVSYKKNGTFKKTVKPIIFEHDYGHYWEDSYGWNTMVIRLEPVSDTELELTITDVVEHY